MEIVLYNNHYEFHFWAGLKPGRLAEFLNVLPLRFRFKRGPDELYRDTERGPGVFVLYRKSQPSEEVSVPSSQANYYLRWNARSSEGNVPQMAFGLARDLSRELETRVWLVDGYGRILYQEGGHSDDDYPTERSA